MTEPILLSFPQWQGADNRPQLKQGGDLLARTFGAMPLIPVGADPILVDRNIWGRSMLLAQHRQAKQELEGQGWQNIVTLGGDCGIEWTLISHLNHLCEGDLLVVWLDGHADLNTPETSPSHTFHGMVLRTLLGEGDPEFLQATGRFLTPQQVVLAGVRDLDPAEEAFMAEQQIQHLPSGELKSGAERLLEAIHQSGFKHIYLHIDLDVLDPSQIQAIGWPAPGGLLLPELLELVAQVRAHFHLQGASITEYLGDDPADLPVVQAILQELVRPMSGA